MQKFTQFKEKLASLEEDAQKFYEKGNGAAGTRLRKGMLELGHMTKDIRKEVIEQKGS